MKNKSFFLFFSLALSVSILSIHAEFTQEDIKSGIQASMLAAACGDALGYPSEQLNFSQQHAPQPSLTNLFKHYPHGIRDFSDLHDAKSHTILENGRAMYTDDTAMAKIVAEVYIQQHQKNLRSNKTADLLAHAFIKDMHAPRGWALPQRAPGNSCLNAMKILTAKIHNNQHLGDLNWWNLGDNEQRNAGGCGSVMRAHPCGLLFSSNSIKWIISHSQDQTLITHGAPMARAACAAMTLGTALALHKLDPYYIAHEMYEAAKKYDVVTADMLQESINLARKNSTSHNFKELFELSKPLFQKFKGWTAHEAIAAALYIFLVCSDNIKDAIYLGANTPGDSDSVASMAGALVGARVGMKNIPSHWISCVELGEEIVALGTKISACIDIDRFNHATKKHQQSEDYFKNYKTHTAQKNLPSSKPSPLLIQPMYE